jgi:hypothetical protein
MNVIMNDLSKDWVEILNVRVFNVYKTYRYILLPRNYKRYSNVTSNVRYTASHEH